MMLTITERSAAYLQRLRLDPDVLRRASCDHDTLALIQRAHVEQVPYETVDIMEGIPLRLDREGLFDKLVRRGRGGYCYELNGALGHLLTDLGYEVETSMGRFFAEGYQLPSPTALEDETLPQRRHRVLRVRLNDAIWLVDAGVGIEAPREPLRLVEGLIQPQRLGDAYYFLRHDFFEWVLMRRRPDGQTYPLYSLTMERQADIDFIPPSYYLENVEDSFFRQALLVSRKTERGRETIDGWQHRIRDYGAGQVEEREIPDRTALETLLRERFGIDVQLTGAWAER